MQFLIFCFHLSLNPLSELELFMLLGLHDFESLLEVFYEFIYLNVFFPQLLLELANLLALWDVLGEQGTIFVFTRLYLWIKRNY